MAGRVGPDDAVEPPVVALEKLINALGNTVFYSFAVLILVFPILVWINGLLGDRRGLLWTGLAILFALVARPLMGWFAESAMDLFEKVRKGELFKPVFQPLRSVAAALSIVSAFRLEYLLVHGEKPLEGESVLQLLWQFFTAL